MLLVDTSLGLIVNSLEVKHSSTTETALLPIMYFTMNTFEHVQELSSKLNKYEHVQLGCTVNSYVWMSGGWGEGLGPGEVPVQ